MKKMTNIIFHIILGFSLAMSSIAQAEPKRGSDIKSWSAQKVEKGFILSNELYYKKFCSKIYSKQIPEFLKKNPKVKDANKFWPGNQITIQECQNLSSKPAKKITRWETIVAPKGFVLYKYLNKQSGCFDKDEGRVWDYHMTEFKEKNPAIESVERIPAGTKIQIQHCDLTELEGTDKDPEVNSQNVNEESLPDALGEAVVETPRVEGDSVKEMAQSSQDTANKPVDDSMLFISGGMLTENEKTNGAIGARFRTSVYPRVEYAARVDAAKTAAYFNHQINFITLPDQNLNQYFLGFGMGQRYGLEPELDANNQKRGVDMYPYVSAGFRRITERTYLELQIGSNLTNQFSPNVSLLGMKRLGKSDFMLGLYADWRNSKSPISEQNQSTLKYFTGGIIFSY